MRDNRDMEKSSDSGALLPIGAHLGGSFRRECLDVGS
jgi:hypothetical protein